MWEVASLLERSGTSRGSVSQRTQVFIPALPPLNESLGQVTQPLTVSVISFLNNILLVQMIQERSEIAKVPGTERGSISFGFLLLSSLGVTAL